MSKLDKAKVLIHGISTFPIKQVCSPHPEIVNELLCVLSLLVSVTPEESRYLRQVHRVLKVREDRFLVQAGLKDL